MNIIEKKYWYLGVSLSFIAAGVVAIFLWGLNLSIDFTGGSRITLAFKDAVTQGAVESVNEIFDNQKIKIGSLEKSDRLVFVRTAPVDADANTRLMSALSGKFEDISQREFETIGPVIGREITLNAIKAIVIASVLIILYITWSFRHVPKPASSFRFGICAIIALIHDVLIVVGAFAVFGHFFGVEIDSLFVTAILTVIGFSVHDTIVVFDRIRENLIRKGSMNFATTVNESIVQTLVRSINTSLTTILVLIALLLFGGETIRWFIVALVIGIVAGTYSSIFTASPLLVLWQELRNKKEIKK